MPHTPQIHSDYLGHVFDQVRLDSFLRKAVKLVKQYDFQAFAFRGMSGALVAPLLAYKTGKTLIMVRKPKVYEFEKETNEGQSYHSYCRVEGDHATERYVILDDMICSGRTINSIVQAINGFSTAKCLGVLLYSDPMSGGEATIRHHLFPTALQQYVCADPEAYRIK